MTEKFQVGAITQTHGIRGEVKVYPTTEDPMRYKTLKKVQIDNGKEKKDLEIEHVRFFKQYVIVKFKGIDNINDVERYKGASLWIDREDAIKLEENEYFVADLIGMQVLGDDGENLGILTDVLQTGANDVYVVEQKGKDTLYIPAIKECILEVNTAEGQMKVHLLDGLRDLNKKGARE